jgi:CHAD domain-containing protein
MAGGAAFGLPPSRSRAAHDVGRYSGVQTQPEIEVKLAASAGIELPLLDGLPGVAAVEHSAPVTLEAVYLDTADLRLARSRTTLRRRTGGTDPGWHLKVPVAPDSRTEYQADLGPQDGGVPADLVALVRARARGGSLGPVASLTTTRTTHRLHDAAGRLLAEVADDEVTARTPDAEHRVIDRWREWEIELVNGDRTLLRAARTLLMAVGGVPPVWWSKLARALSDRLAAADAGPSGDPSRIDCAGAIVRERLRSQLEELVAGDPLVRTEEPESMHQMRVATRRMGSALATYRSLLDGRRSDEIRAELGWLAGLLGAARDAEVMRLRLTELVAKEPEELRDVTAIERLDTDRAAAYRGAWGDVRDALDSSRYLRLLDGLDAIVGDPSPVADLEPEPAAVVLAAGVRREVRRLGRSVRAALAAPPGPARDGLLHEARKAAKRTRYAAETAEPAVGRRAAEHARRVEELQTLLGDHHDTVELRAVLRRVGGEARGASEDTFLYGRWHAIEQGVAERDEAALLAVWAPIKAERRRRWLR